METREELLAAVDLIIQQLKGIKEEFSRLDLTSKIPALEDIISELEQLRFSVKNENEFTEEKQALFDKLNHLSGKASRHKKN